MKLIVPESYEITHNKIEKAIDSCKKENILVIGDDATDVTYSGGVAGRSKDADIGVFIVNEKLENPGCAGNVREQCSALCNSARLLCDPFLSVKHIKFVENGEHVFRATAVDRINVPFQYQFREMFKDHELGGIIFAEYNEWGKGWLGDRLQQVFNAVMEAEMFGIPCLLSLRTMPDVIPDIPVVTNIDNQIKDNGYKRKSPTIYTNRDREIVWYLDEQEYCDEPVIVRGAQSCQYVGAGDAFSSGLISARISGVLSWEESIQFAAIAAASFIYTSNPRGGLGYIDPEIMLDLVDIGSFGEE